MLCSLVTDKTDTQTDRQTDRQTDTKVNTEDTLSGFQEFFLQPIIKERSNIDDTGRGTPESIHFLVFSL